MTEWQIQPDADDAAAYAFLAGDRRWGGYSIADLEPPLRQYARVALAGRGAAPPAAACLFLHHPAFDALVTHGDPAGVAAILAATPDLPRRTFVLAQPQHIAPVETRYVFGAREAMYRMAADAGTFQPPGPLPAVERLGLDDLAALEALYAPYAASAFNADQLRHGVFYGVRGGAGLLAAGGTHALAPRYGLAAVGNIFTRPEARGRGYAGAITAAVVAELLRGPYREIILNVAVENAVARRLYARLGFGIHCRYEEGAATLAGG